MGGGDISIFLFLFWGVGVGGGDISIFSSLFFSTASAFLLFLLLSLSLFVLNIAIPLSLQ